MKLSFEISSCYQLTGLAKIEQVKEYIKNLLENNTKIIVFAYHKQVLNILQQFLNQILCVSLIRIDGDVSSEKRFERVKEFQNNLNIKVALLSLAAASTGLTLTASSNVVFAEVYFLKLYTLYKFLSQLDWTPAIMCQAEDRAHRIGQKNNVLCHYILGQNTLDEILYQKLEKKTFTISQILDGEQKQFDNQKENLQIQSELQPNINQNQSIYHNTIQIQQQITVQNVNLLQEKKDFQQNNSQNKENKNFIKQDIISKQDTLNIKKNDDDYDEEEEIFIQNLVQYIYNIKMIKYIYIHILFRFKIQKRKNQFKTKIISKKIQNKIKNKVYQMEI
ncbi:hypothetical protein IMG5_023540 [Ichthyophthirius multifiliis]|uniref:Helicase C-terminal domain-containing protein n=1 Tax=Ichthyophthirius multifiliis TaxID=5932 RepID=G0QKX9_ICHMU|nr:hypothetical protein IMG5_023540 [Ichthyophthirius multifiliis]EGR34130.1 hypothetical protein IMG5_023540 [Ichthyophthirius multifiliis]|eukprot:XP_004039434.1 hypothetical protein IMG5_023540 [Ichthyophthirius multifiliis]